MIECNLTDKDFKEVGFIVGFCLGASIATLLFVVLIFMGG